MTKKEMAEIGQKAAKQAIISSYQDMIRNLESRISPNNGNAQNKRYWAAIRGLERDIEKIRQDDDKNYKED